MFNPNTYNVTSAAGSVNMTFYYSGTAYEPSFSSSGDVNITSTSYVATFTVEDLLTPNSPNDTNNFITELYSYGIPRSSSLTLMQDGYIVPSSQEEAESLYEVLQYVHTQTLTYGTVGDPDVTVSGTLTVNYGANSTASQKVSTITLEVDVDLDAGTTATYTATLTQAAYSQDGSITITPSTDTVYGSTGTRTYTITSSNMDSSSITYSTSGANMFNTVAFNAAKTEVTVTFLENSTSDSRVGTLTISGTDLGGTTRTSSTTITQLAKPSIEFQSSSQNKKVSTSATGTNLLLDATYCSNPTATFSGTLTVTSHSFAQTSGGYTLTLSYGQNQDTAVKSTTVTVSATGNDGNTYTTSTTLSQAPYSQLVITPASGATVLKDAGTLTIAFSGTNVDFSTLSCDSMSGSMNVTSVTFNSAHTEATVTYGANSGSSTLSKTLTFGYTAASDTVPYYHKTVQWTINQLSSGSSITIAPNTQTISATQTTATYTVTADGISNLTASASGTVNVTNTSLTEVTAGSYTLTVTTGDNTGTANQTSTITVSGVNALGNTVTQTATLIKEGRAGSITVSPTTKTVTRAGGSAEFQLTLDNIDTSTLTWEADQNNTMVITGVNFNAGFTTATVYYGVNNTGNQLNGIVRIIADDNNGVSRSATITLTQLGSDSGITLTPNSRTLAATETTTMYVVSHPNISNLTVNISGTVSINRYYWDGDDLYVVTNNNTGSSQLQSTVTVSGTDTLGTSYSGTATLIKGVPDGEITLTPVAAEVSSLATSYEFSYTLSNVDPSTLSTGDSGDITFSSITIDTTNNKLVLAFPVNSDTTAKQSFITLGGTGSNGNNVSATVSLTQRAVDGYLRFAESSKILNATETTVIYFIQAYGMSNVTASFSGTVGINSHSLEATTGGYNLTVVTLDNTTTTQQTSTITVTGTTTENRTLTTTATLIKRGVGGSITISPSTANVSYAAGTATFEVTTTNMGNVLNTNAWGDMNITSRSLINGILTVNYGANSSTSPIIGNVSVYGDDVNGYLQSDSVTITQAGRPADGYILISPSTQSVGKAAGSIYFALTTSNINANTLNVSVSGSMTIINTSINSTRVTISYGANNGSSQKNATITVTGTDLNGVTRTATGTLIQNAQVETNYTFEFLPSNQISRTISKSGDTLYYTINSSKTVSGTTTNLGYDVSSITYSGTWGTQITTRYSDGKPYFVVPSNSGSSSRRATITFVQNESGNNIVATINQYGNTTTHISPIWKDVFFSDSADVFTEYHIELNGDLIYGGKAYKYPDASGIEWSVNDVVSNYLGNGITFQNGIQQIPNYCKTFYIYTNNGASYSEKFYNSWAYKDTDYMLSDPIDYRVDPRQWLPVSFLSTNFNSIQVGNTAYTAPSSDNGWTVMTNLRSLTLDCGGYFTVTPYTGSQMNFKIDCGDFVLYYANAYGGWDSLLVKGTSKKTDNIEHYNYRKKTKNRSEFSKVNYQNVITPTWSLNTGITVNGQKMYHLLESPTVYLHNLETNEIVPVVITNSTCEYLTYTNNGKKPYFYTITVEESQLKIRK